MKEGDKVIVWTRGTGRYRAKVLQIEEHRVKVRRLSNRGLDRWVYRGFVEEIKNASPQTAASAT